MPVSKTSSIIFDNVILNNEIKMSSVIDLSHTWHSVILVKFTNSSIGPSLAPMATVETSANAIDWYQSSSFIGDIVNNKSCSTTLLVLAALPYARVVLSPGIGGTPVVVRVEICSVTDVNLLHMI